jgi:hypothetical protein
MTGAANSSKTAGEDHGADMGRRDC